MYLKYMCDIKRLTRKAAKQCRARQTVTARTSRRISRVSLSGKPLPPSVRASNECAECARELAIRSQGRAVPRPGRPRAGQICGRNQEAARRVRHGGAVYLHSYGHLINMSSTPRVTRLHALRGEHIRIKVLAGTPTG
eukprot:scaffold339_cov402-Prasinococcus_capsulatus_cf.AAC.16